MTLEECYEKIGGNYKEVVQRLPGENFVKKFAVKFLDDPSFETLKKGLEEQELETAFRGAHTLKGVCQNLSFDALYQVSAALTESLRAGTLEGSGPLFAKVEEQYRRTVEGLRELQ